MLHGYLSACLENLVERKVYPLLSSPFAALFPNPKYGYFADLADGRLLSFAFIEAGYGINDRAGFFSPKSLVDKFFAQASYVLRD